jgi:hypothetical protein
MAGIVSTGPGKPTAVLVVSAWRQGVPPRLTARIIYTLDVTRPDRVTVTTASADEIETVVGRWLEEFQRGGSGDAPVTAG